jgi:beta-xylosidase
LKANNHYYIFGTGWQGYFAKSKDLSRNWISLGNVVETPADFAGDPWAPEVYEYEGAYYMFTTYKSKETGRRGCAVFRSEKPGGPYKLHSDGHVTPKEWDAIDGSLYVDKDGQPWMIFVHEWVSTDDGVGRMACAKLSKDLKSFISEPMELFRADDAPWATQGVTDGCWIYRCQDESLLMIWSNWDQNGYCIGVARSPSGEVTGPWEQQKERLFSKMYLGDYDGGHGMIFTDFDGKLWLSLHSPNNGNAGRIETPIFVPIKEENNRLVWDFVKRG